jgi:hypothetical protein
MTEDSQVGKAFPANNNNSISENILFHKTIGLKKKSISVAVEKERKLARQLRKKKPGKKGYAQIMK